MSILPCTEDFASMLRAAQIGSSSALGSLLAQFRPYLDELAAHSLGSSLRPKESASDLVQESLFAATVGFPEFRGKSLGEFREWLARILERRAIDVARRFRGPQRDVGRESKEGNSHLQLMASREPDPHEQSRRQEVLSRLLSHLQTLPDVDRRLIRWRYEEGLSFEEIGKRLSWPRETTRRRWYEVIEQIGRHMEAHS